MTVNVEKTVTEAKMVAKELTSSMDKVVKVLEMHLEILN